MNDPKNTPPHDESSLPTTPNAQSRAAYFEDMLPGVIASDERDGRLAQALKRRRAGVPLSAEEVRRDLKAVLSQLTVAFMQYEHSFSTFLRTPAHALDYAERVAAYAMKDYPREFEDDADILGMWDTLKTIHVLGYAWRKGEDKTDGKQLVVTVNKIATDGMNRIYPVEKEPEMPDVEALKSQSTADPTAKLSKAAVMAELEKQAEADAAELANLTTRPSSHLRAAVDAETVQKPVENSSAAHETPSAEANTPTGAAETAKANDEDEEKTDVSEGRLAETADQTGAEAEKLVVTVDQMNTEEHKADGIVDQTETKADKTDDAAVTSAEKSDNVSKVDDADPEDEDDKIDLSW